MSKLRRLTVDQLPADCFEPVDPKALDQAKAIVEDIKAGGEPAFIKWATKLGDIKEGESYIATKDELKAAFDGLSEENRGVLTRVVNFISAPRMGCRSFKVNPLLIPGREDPNFRDSSERKHQGFRNRNTRR